MILIRDRKKFIQSKKLNVTMERKTSPQSGSKAFEGLAVLRKASNKVQKEHIYVEAKSTLLYKVVPQGAKISLKSNSGKTTMNILLFYSI